MKLILGTVQLGIDYGINKQKPSLEKSLEILNSYQGLVNLKYFLYISLLLKFFVLQMYLVLLIGCSLQQPEDLKV